MLKISNYISPSRVINWLLIISLLLTIFNIKSYKKEKGVIYWDVISYYAYLPATFIHKDLTLGFMGEIPGDYGNKFWPSKTAEGKRVIKTSMGLSIMYAPAFLIAHSYCLISGDDADGFTAPYKLALLLASIFYMGVGLSFLRKILVIYFSELVTSLTLVAVVAATNLYHYSSMEGAMSHSFSFALFILFIFTVLKWYKKPNVINIIFLGLLGGLITLIRPTNIIIFLLFVFYDIKSVGDIGIRFKFLLERYRLVIIMAISFIVVWIPQFIYWKIATGSWFYYSYGEEGFFFSDPQILNGLFSYRKGWFIYTPIMFFAVSGIFLLRKRLNSFFIPILLFTILNIYIILSWWCWWYGGGFGLRPFIDSYGILAIPLAVVIERLFSLFKGKRVVFSWILCGVILLHGIFQNVKYHYNSIHYDSMTKEAYWDSFLRVRPSAKYWELLSSPDYAKARKGIEEY